jgi:hypothetical protein
MLFKESSKQFFVFTFKVIIAHTLTYFIFGLIMSNIFDYQEIWNQEVVKDFMRPMNSPWIMIGPFLQPIRGLLFAIGIWPIREIILSRKYGWLILWNIIIIFGILSTPAAAPCSIEGLLYSQLPLWFHLIGLPEIILQSLAFSLLLGWWINRPPKDKNDKPQKKQTVLFLRIIFPIMIACFGYIGYAIGGILVAKLSGVAINVSGSSISLKGQLMFVFAFLINVFALFIIITKHYHKKIPSWTIFVLFWILDTTSLLLYQACMHHMMPVHMALIMGFFPSLIITLSIKFNSSKFEQVKMHD